MYFSGVIKVLDNNKFRINRNNNIVKSRDKKVEVQKKKSNFIVLYFRQLFEDIQTIHQMMYEHFFLVTSGIGWFLTCIVMYGIKVYSGWGWKPYCIGIFIAFLIDFPIRYFVRLIKRIERMLEWFEEQGEIN